MVQIMNRCKIVMIFFVILYVSHAAYSSGATSNGESLFCIFAFSPSK